MTEDTRAPMVEAALAAVAAAGSEGVTARDLAAAAGCSQELASNTLRRLFQAGKLDREKDPAEGRGNRPYRYTAA